MNVGSSIKREREREREEGEENAREEREREEGEENAREEGHFTEIHLIHLYSPLTRINFPMLINTSLHNQCTHVPTSVAFFF